MVDAQYPSRIDDFEVKFWRYSLSDLARITASSVFGAAVGGLPGAAVGASAGLGLAEFTYNGKTLDQLTTDYLSYQTGQRQLDVEGELRDQVVVLDDGTVLGLVEMESVDLDMASDTRWQVNRDIVAELYREIESPIQIHSRKETVDLSSYRCRTDKAVVTNHYVAVTEHPATRSVLPWNTRETRPTDDRVEDVVDRCVKIRNTLNAGNLSAKHVTGSQLKDVVNRFSFPDLSVNRQRYTVGTGEKSHRRLLCLAEYPQQREAGLLSDVLNLDVPGFVDTVQTVTPVSDKQRRKLSRVIGRMRVESTVTPDPIRGSDIDRKLQDAQQMLAAELNGKERLVNHAAYIVTRGDSWEEVDATVEAVTRLLRRYGVEYREPWLETPQAVQTESLVRGDALEKGMVMPARSAASNFSFSTHDVIEDGGVVFGVDTRHGQPVILNRYSWEAGDIARMGKKGSGKSYSAKLTLLRSVQQYPELQLHILDPKREYGVIGDALDGSLVVLDDTDLDRVAIENDVVRYTVNDRSQNNTELLTEAMEHIYRSVSQDRAKKIVLVDEAWQLLTDARGRKAVAKLVREGRDVNACVELVTQNATDFTQSQEGRDILKNLNSYIFFNHQDVATGVSKFFNLSPEETIELCKLPTGNDLPYSEAIIRGPVNTKLRITATPEEHAIIREVDS